MDQTNEENKEEFERVDFTKPDFVFEPKEHHEWRQQGPYLVCKSCEVEHASWVGMGRIMVGLNSDGQPILKERLKF